MVFGVGASLALGGVAQLLTPVPKISGPGAASMGSMSSGAKGADDSDPRKNYSFSGIQNTSRQGVPVPVIYGEVIVGSVVISAGIDVDQVAS
jgi:predicted phage tail protein